MAKTSILGLYEDPEDGELVSIEEQLLDVEGTDQFRLDDPLHVTNPELFVGDWGGCSVELPPKEEKLKRAIRPEVADGKDLPFVEVTKGG